MEILCGQMKVILWFLETFCARFCTAVMGYNDGMQTIGLTNLSDTLTTRPNPE